jgi:hypothetical protein
MVSFRENWESLKEEAVSHIRKWRLEYQYRSQRERIRR